ncbi:MAG: CoA pyrophosphatase [Planctomycetes bacterium]|nr:CoA pyrophosphatase [Planctomycetota bacterium]
MAEPATERGGRSRANVSRPLPLTGADPPGEAARIARRLLELAAPRDPWPGLRDGAALLLLLPASPGPGPGSAAAGPGGWRVAVTRRSEAVRGHKGQMSLPGGGREAGDADVEATALREAREEIGVAPGLVRVLGFLGRFYVHVSLFHLGVVVGTVDGPVAFAPAPREVSRLFLPTLDELYKQYEENGYRRISDPVKATKPDLNYWVEEEEAREMIWGATGRVLTDFFARVVDHL